MPFIPLESLDPFDIAGQAFDAIPSLNDFTTNRNLPGFGAPPIPGQNGNGIRQKQIQNSRGAVHKRNMVKWFVPEVGIVEMYINPQSITYNQKKQITNQRTKGGYLLQYWGEELMQLNIQGTTGSSGIEGINVLEDIYRAEQNAYDPYALALSAQNDKDNDILSFFEDAPSSSLFGGVTESFANLLNNASEAGAPLTSRPKPTLASLAFSVEMYYSGWVFRGYFTDFRVEERAEKLGLFDYSMTFMVTQRRGFRANFLGWHRSAVDGASNSDPEFGRPHSYRGITVPEQFPPTRRKSEEEGISLTDALAYTGSLVGSIAAAPITTFSSIF